MVNELMYDLNLISKYRTPLMGIAALMIILCHAPQYGVAMPNSISSVMLRGGLGVDIFLYLSGVGCWYSLSKGVTLKKWYCKRFIRIFIPYFFMQFPFWALKIFNGSFSIMNELMVFSTINFWLYHVGAWYVALLIPLYIVTPFIYKILELGNRVFIALLMVVVIITVCMLNIDMFVGIIYEILRNLQWAFGRVPSFIIGMAMAPLIKKGVKFNIFALIIIPLLLYVAIHLLIDKNTPTEWCLVLPVLSVFIVFIPRIYKLNTIYNFFSWMGLVSLESYLANIYLCGAVKDVLRQSQNANILFTGGYLEYSIVIVLGLLLSYIVNKMSRIIIKRIEIPSNLIINKNV